MGFRYRHADIEVYGESQQSQNRFSFLSKYHKLHRIISHYNKSN